MIRGSVKFDGITIGELSANFLGTTLSMRAKAAFVNSKTGTTHGWTEGTNWSPPTVAKLKELTALMEVDLARQHFDNSSDDPTVSTSPENGGLGEHLTDVGDQV